MCVSWIVADLYTCTDALLNDKPKSHNFMRAIGIISLKIGDSIIYEGLDEFSSIFESAFLEALELKDIVAMELLLEMKVVLSLIGILTSP